MICRKLYAHKGSILLNSGSDHGKPRRLFLLRVSSGEDLVCYSCDGRYCIGQEPDGTETKKEKTAFRRAGPNFERPLLRAIYFFCGV